MTHARRSRGKETSEAIRFIALCHPFRLMSVRDELRELAADLRTRTRRGGFKRFGASEKWLLKQAAALDRHADGAGRVLDGLRHGLLSSVRRPPRRKLA